MIPTNTFNIQGLTTSEVIAARQKFGVNKRSYKKENGFLDALKGLVKEPLIILLLAPAIIYFLSGKTGDAIFLVGAIVLVSAISLYQDKRSKNALKKMENFSQPSSKVIRNGQVTQLKSEDIVVGDSMLVEEGAFISADGTIVHSNDFSVNESVVTGESFPVFKDINSEDKVIYSGTTVASGLAIVTITNTGNDTKLGKIGKSLEGIKEEKTPLEVEINNFVKKVVITGVIIFLVLWAIGYFRSNNFLDSLLGALTLAMSILPEEIPVAFAAFMALGAWRLMKLGVVVKQMKTVETLGSATVICTDKTGTITENKMSLAKLFSIQSGKISDPTAPLSESDKDLLGIAMWASESLPFDPMEIALHKAYDDFDIVDERPNYKLIREYQLGGKPPMTTHIFENKTGKRIIAAKGAPEAIIAVTDISEVEKQSIHKAITALTTEGYRVLAVAEANFTGSHFPVTQQEFKFSFKGIVAFYDPPKVNINKVLNHFYDAGIAVKIITGDNTETTTSIAKQIGFSGYDKSITGDALMLLDAKALKDVVMHTNIFTRMFPEAKLKIINALKAQHQVVAMTGDGVNDGPALKAAHIGIAMGKKGTEIAKQSASLILANDDLSKMVDAIAMGRRIYANLKKAIQYIISIHIPIILTVFVPLAFGWMYPNIFSPLQVIFLEIIMGPTCSIIYENEPIEKNTMLQKPRPTTKSLFSGKELLVSLVQGLVIAVGSLLTYQYAVTEGYSEALTRTMVFAVLIVANIFLTLVNRSFYYSVFTTLRYKNNLVPLIIGITLATTAVLFYVKPVTAFFLFETPNFTQLGVCGVVGSVSVLWVELLKWTRRLKSDV